MAETREQLLEEAYRLRDLGRYPEAHSCFGKAREQADDLMLAVNIASTYMEQGCVKKCLEEINVAMQEFGSSTSDQAVVALAKTLQASAVTATTLRFRDSLKAGSDLFDQHLRELPVEKYEGKFVALLLGYYYMRRLAELCGFDVSTAPVPSLIFIKSLYRYLAGSERFADAFRIAKVYAAAAGPQLQTSLLDEFLALEGIPELVQAEALGEVANLLHGADRQDDALSKLETAIELYRNKEHATGPLLLEVQRFAMQPFGDKAQREVRRLTLFRLKSELESFECYDGMRQAINALYQLAQVEQDDTLRVELDYEMQRLSTSRGCPMDWISQQLILVNNWKRAGPSTGQMLLSLEALYGDMEIMEAPAVRAGVAQTLADKYRGLGNIAKAEKWTSTANAEQGIGPRYIGFLDGTDLFYRTLEESTTAPEDEEDEIRALREELLQVVEDVRPETTPPGAIYFGIMKVTYMCELYMDKFIKYKLRGFDHTKRLVETCLEFSNALIQILPSSQKKKWEGTVITVKARLLSIQAVSCGKPNPQAISDIINSEVLCTAIEAYDEAASLFSEAGLELNNAQALQQVAGCHKQMWILNGYSPTSEHFATVVEKYEAAGKVMKMHGSIEQQQLNAFALLSHWYMGYERKVTYRKGSYEETIACLGEAEKIIDQERQELSALSHHEAVLAKQNMRRNKSINLVFETAIKLFGTSGDMKSLWDWVQRSKARSVSDLMGLGINLPTDLKQQIESDPVTSELLAKEAALAKLVKSAAPSAQFFARKALETHQRTMSTHDKLREVLELRLGKPTTWERLQQLHDLNSARTKRRTWFVDWFTIESKIFLIAVSNETEVYHGFRLNMNLEDVSQWIKENLDGKDALNEDDSLASLVQLSKLVDPIINGLTKEGDLLVLCMTGILHRLPVHAAIIEGDPDEPRDCKTLVERNPVIYASSMTISQQCTTRSLIQAKDVATSQGEHHQRGTVLSVYEDPGEYTSSGWQSEREQIYEMCRDLATQMQWDDAFCGLNVRRSRFEAACESDIVLFFGHFYYNTDNILEQGIVLAPPGVPAGDPTNPTHAHGFPPERIFSVTDIFSSKVKTSHFSLIACGSATQAIQQGDEPLGIVTALLYAGATSVTGTLWPIESRAGRAFTQSFYKHFQSGKSEGGSSVIDLAIALQEAVRTMRGVSDWVEPYFWAGFVLHGTWRYSRRV